MSIGSSARSLWSPILIMTGVTDGTDGAVRGVLHGGRPLCPALQDGRCLAPALSGKFRNLWRPCSVAAAADGSFERRAHPDDPVSGPAFATKTDGTPKGARRNRPANEFFLKNNPMQQGRTSVCLLALVEMTIENSVYAGVLIDRSDQAGARPKALECQRSRSANATARLGPER